MEIWHKPSIEECEDESAVNFIETIDEWRSSVLYLLTGELLAYPSKARVLRTRVSCFTVIESLLNRHAFSMPLLKCLGPHKAQCAIDEVYEGVCGEHLEAIALAMKVLRAGFF